MVTMFAEIIIYVVGHACDVAKYTIAENVEFRLKNATVNKTF